MKIFVNALSASRIFGAISLLFLAPLSMAFYVVYALCVLTDIVDGPIARRAGVASNFGALLDSAADFLLVIVVLIILVPYLPLQLWMLLAIAFVLAIRFLGFGIGFAKYRTFTMLHTYANKGQGLLFAFFPLFLGLLGLHIAFVIVLIGAVLSAIEELIITYRSKELNRNVTSLFRMG